MDFTEFYSELRDIMDNDYDIWFLCTSGPEDENGNPTNLLLLLDRFGYGIARCQYSPDPDLRDWRVSLWPRGPFFFPLPAAAVLLNLSKEKAFGYDLTILESVYRNF